MTDQSTTRLTALSSLSPETAQRLAGMGIDTVELLLGIAATPNGRELIGRQLGMQPEQVDALLNEARAAAPRAAELGAPADVSNRGGGALRPPWLEPSSELTPDPTPKTTPDAES